MVISLVTSKVKLVDLKRQFTPYLDSINSGIEEVISSSSFINGPKVTLLEERLAAFTEVRHAVGVSSGTDALTLSLMALGVGAGDRVITTPFTFFATVESILLLGAVPLFVDIDPETYNLDWRKLEETLDQEKGGGALSRIKGIIAISLYGQPCDMDEINRAAEKAGLFVIEDACQSLGATYKNKKSCGLSHIGLTSFFPTKPLGCFGDGGMIFTSDDELAKRIAILRNHGQSERYIHRYVGMNGRLDALQAAVLLAKLPHFPKEIAMRQQRAEFYDSHLEKKIKPPVIRSNRKSAYALYTVRVKNRADVIERLTTAGIETAVHYPVPIHLQEVLCGFGFKEGDFPESERASKEVLSLPFHPDISDREQLYVVENLFNAI